MSLAAAIRSAVTAANAVTADLHEEVTHERFVEASDGYGTPEFDPVPVTRSAMVQRREGVLQTADGREVRFRAVITFLAPVAVDLRDRITLADGYTGPILQPQGGLLDPDTGQPFMRTVHLG